MPGMLCEPDAVSERGRLTATGRAAGRISGEAGGQDVCQAHGHPRVGCLVPVDGAPEAVVGLHSLIHGGLLFVKQEVYCSNHLTVGSGAEAAGDEGV